MYSIQLVIYIGFLFYLVRNYKLYLGDSVRKTLKKYFIFLLVRPFSAGFFALIVAIGTSGNDTVNDNWTVLQLVNSLIQIICFMASFILFYHFLLKLKKV